MALIAAKCTECGANIKVDESKDAGICQHCGTAFVTQKAINNYNVNYNVTKIITNAKESAEDLLQNAIVLYNLEEYEQAYKLVKKAKNIDASNYMIWYYIAMCIHSGRFEYDFESKWSEDIESEKYDAINNAYELADTDDKKKEIKDGYITIFEHIAKVHSWNVEHYQEEVDSDKERYQKNKKKYDVEKATTEKLKKQLSTAQTAMWAVGIILIICGFWMTTFLIMGFSVLCIGWGTVFSIQEKIKKSTKEMMFCDLEGIKKDIEENENKVTREKRLQEFAQQKADNAKNW